MAKPRTLEVRPPIAGLSQGLGQVRRLDRSDRSPSLRGCPGSGHPLSLSNLHRPRMMLISSGPSRSGSDHRLPPMGVILSEPHLGHQPRRTSTAACLALTALYLSDRRLDAWRPTLPHGPDAHAADVPLADQGLRADIILNGHKFDIGL